jgi:hypothetical protein
MKLKLEHYHNSKKRIIEVDVKPRKKKIFVNLKRLERELREALRDV